MPPSPALAFCVPALCAFSPLRTTTLYLSKFVACLPGRESQRFCQGTDPPSELGKEREGAGHSCVLCRRVAIASLAAQELCHNIWSVGGISLSAWLAGRHNPQRMKADRADSLLKAALKGQLQHHSSFSAASTQKVSLVVSSKTVPVACVFRTKAANPIHTFLVLSPIHFSGLISE